jgi:hypothetical protein
MKRIGLQNCTERYVLKILIFTSPFIVQDSYLVFVVHSGVDVVSILSP